MQTWIFFFVNFDLVGNENRVLLTQKSKLSHELMGNEHFETSILRFSKNPWTGPYGPILIESKNWVAKLTPNFFSELCPLPVLIEATQNTAFSGCFARRHPCFNVKIRSTPSSIVHASNAVVVYVIVNDVANSRYKEEDNWKEIGVS